MNILAKVSRRPITRILRALALVLPLTIAPPSLANPDLCRSAARAAATATGVPFDVLLAISLTETGRRRGGAVQPWPWTINMEGVGKWFDTREAALRYAQRHHDAGARSFDLGCFQINYRWHGTAFASLDRMIDPNGSALYAARFLLRLYRELGDWSLAAGAYHSRNEEFASRYRRRFDRLLAGLRQALPTELSDRDPVRTASSRTDRPRINSYPLLQSASAAPVLGSLVPLGGAPAGRLVALE